MLPVELGEKALQVPLEIGGGHAWALSAAAWPAGLPESRQPIEEVEGTQRLCVIVAKARGVGARLALERRSRVRVRVEHAQRRHGVASEPSTVPW